MEDGWKEWGFREIVLLCSCPHSKEEPKLFCALAPEETVVPGFYKSQFFKVITVIVKDRERVKGLSELSLE